MKIEDAGIEWTIIFAGGGRGNYRLYKDRPLEGHLPVIVNLNIKADGTLFWNGAAVTPGQFFQYLAEAAKARPNSYSMSFLTRQQNTQRLGQFCVKYKGIGFGILFWGRWKVKIGTNYHRLPNNFSISLSFSST